MRYFYADQQSRTIGPLPYSQLQSLYHQGKLKPNTLVLEEGGTEWASYSEVFLSQDMGVSSEKTSVQQSFYTLSTTGTLHLKEAKGIKRGEAVVLDKAVRTDDGTKKKIIIGDQANLPEDPKEAIRIFIKQQEEKICFIEENLYQERKLLEEAKKMQQHYEQES